MATAYGDNLPLSSAGDALPGSVPCSQIELTISCRKLMDMDTFSKSDPMCVVFIRNAASDQWRELGRTEIIWNNLNPNFAKKFQVDYFFEERQYFKFQIYDVDSKSRDLSRHDFLGEMECTLAEIVSHCVYKRPLRGPNITRGGIIVSAEELTSSHEEITLQFCGKKLDKKDFFGKSDPFLEFWKANEASGATLAHRSEVIKNTLNPSWKQFKISSRSLCNGDYDRNINIVCYDWDSDGGHDLIGSFDTTLRQLQEGPGPVNSYPCINAKKAARKGKKYTDSGTIILQRCSVEVVPSFVDFIRGGTQIHCTVAVDFTASNGDPRAPNSLHYIDPYRPNQYQQALSAVMEIIQDYDSDKLFPALGFGAQLRNGTVSHEFFLNGHQSNPYCQGVNGVLQAYQTALNSVRLYGPTNFAPVINHVARIASSHTDGMNYFILVILTDGIISDMAQTTKAIVNSARLPMSIIIIGIGNEDFENMDILDGDDVRVSYNGVYAERDIVQFVPIRECMGGRNDGRSTANTAASKARLAKEVLAEIPDQFVGWMRARGIKPKPPVVTRHDSLTSEFSQFSMDPGPQPSWSQNQHHASAPPPPPPPGATAAGYDSPPPYQP